MKRMNQPVVNLKEPQLAHDGKRFDQPDFLQYPRIMTGIKFTDASERHIPPRHRPAIDDIDNAKRLTMPMPLDHRPAAAANQQRPAMVGRPSSQFQRLHAGRDQRRPGLFDGNRFHLATPSKDEKVLR
jgi:hypothetical protein